MKRVAQHHTLSITVLNFCAPASLGTCCGCDTPHTSLLDGPVELASDVCAAVHQLMVSSCVYHSIPLPVGGHSTVHVHVLYAACCGSFGSRGCGCCGLPSWLLLGVKLYADQSDWAPCVLKALKLHTVLPCSRGCVQTSTRKAELGSVWGACPCSHPLGALCAPHCARSMRKRAVADRGKVGVSSLSPPLSSAGPKLKL